MVLRESLFGSVWLEDAPYFSHPGDGSWHPPAVQEKAQGEKNLAVMPILASHREACFSMFLPTHCIAPAHNGLQTASTLRSMGTKAELSKPYKGK